MLGPGGQYVLFLQALLLSLDLRKVVCLSPYNKQESQVYGDVGQLIKHPPSAHEVLGSILHHCINGAW